MFASQSEIALSGYLLTDFVKEVPRELTCGICLNVLKNPHQCQEGHLFCLGCVSKALSTNQKCPVCQLPLAIATLGRNRVVDDQIAALLVHCTKSTEPDGCFWYGTLAQRDAHLFKCPLQPVECQMNVLGTCKDCSGQVMRRDEQSHYLIQTMSVDVVTAAASYAKVLSKTVEDQSLELNALKNALVPGHSVMADSVGNIYSGEMLNGMKHGTGTMKYASGTKSYAGQWERNVYHGHGILRVGGDIYSGVFRDGLKQGHFHCQYADDSTFDGQYENDERVRGTCVYADGDKYDGEWKGNLMHGFGVYSFLGGDFYKGDFLDDKMHGRGVQTDTDDQVYDGEWRAGKRSGHGVCTYSDGEVYTGQFKDNKMHGEGSMKPKRGRAVKGVWEEGVLQK